MTTTPDNKDQVVKDLEEIKTLIDDINQGDTAPPTKEKDEKTYNPFDSLRRLSVIDSKK